MRATQICSVLFAMLLVKTMASCQKENAASIIKANNKFTSTMYGLLSQNPGNVFYSPLSLHTALSMLHQGAEGKTLKALSSVLNLPDKESSADGFEKITRELKHMHGVTLKIANKLYIKTGYSFKPEFKDVVQKFNAAIENVDFTQNEAAAKTINSWVEKKTHHKIKDLISPDDLDEYMRSLIINAIYFKGDWKEKFSKADTRKGRFYTSDTDSVEVDMMHHSWAYDNKMDKHLDAQVIKLPYANEKLSMLFVLPNKRSGITELEDKLTNYNLSKLMDGMKNSGIQLAIPKFMIEMKLDLKEPLKKVGLSNIFNKKANFSGLLDNSEHLYVSKVVQKAFIEVNEDGSEAAVATDIEVIRFISVFVSTEPEVTFDHPFIFALAIKRNILFYGRMVSFD